MSNGEQSQPALPPEQTEKRPRRRRRMLTTDPLVLKARKAAYHAKWREKNREQLNAKSRERYRARKNDDPDAATRPPGRPKNPLDPLVIKERQAAYYATWREQNREHLNAKARERYHARKDEKRDQINAKRRERNRARVQAEHRKSVKRLHYDKNRELILEYKRLYYEANRERILAAKRLRDAAKRLAKQQTKLNDAGA